MKTTRETIRKGLLAVLAILMTLSLIACGSSGGSGGGGDLSDDKKNVVKLNCENISNPHNKKLCELGINTEIGNRTDLQGDEIPENANPLGKDIATIGKFSELFIAGTKIDYQGDSYHGNSYYHLVDEPVVSGDELLTPHIIPPPSPLLFWPHKLATSGDIDGDGLEEVVMLASLMIGNDVYAINLFTIEDVKEDCTESEVFLFHNPLPLDLETGDIDNDGKDEIIVILGSDTAHLTPNTIIILDDQDEGFSLIDEITANVYFSDVAVEDIDNDGIDEIIAIDNRGKGNTSKYYIYDDRSQGSFDLIREAFLINGTVELTQAGYIVVGDFDGDKYLEIAVSDGTYVLFIDDYKGIVPINGFNWEREGYQFVNGHYRHNSLVDKFIGVDLDGNGTDELLVGDDIIRLNPGARERSIDVLHTNIIDRFYTGSETPFWSVERSSYAVGDFQNDGSGKEEIAIIVSEYGNFFNGKEIWILGHDENNQLTLFRTIDLDHDNGTYIPVIAGANVDNDSVVVKYRGEHEVLFTEPVIIGVLASPPYYASGIQETEGSTTTLGKESETSDKDKHTIGFSTETSLGVKISTPIWDVAEFSVKGFLELATSGSWGSVTKNVQTQEYRNSAGKDMVIFSAIPYDVYYYTVLASPKPDAVGTTISVNVPRKLRIHHLDRNYYNEHNSDFADIDATVLTHTVGDPFSYPTFAERNELFFNSPYSIMSYNSMTVSGSGDVHMLGASLTRGSSFGIAEEVTSGVEVEASVIITVGETVKFSYGYEYTHSVSETTSIAGEVGDMLQEHFDISKSYDWSVFLYTHQLGEMSFPVVTYAVER